MSRAVGFSPFAELVLTVFYPKTGLKTGIFTKDLRSYHTLAISHFCQVELLICGFFVAISKHLYFSLCVCVLFSEF